MTEATAELVSERDAIWSFGGRVDRATASASDVRLWEVWASLFEGERAAGTAGDRAERRD